MYKISLRKYAFWRWSIFPKVLLVFILVITPFYLIGISLNERGSASVYSEISQTMNSRLQYFTNQLELEFDKVTRFQNEFVNDDDLIELSGKSEIMTDPEKTFAMIRLQKRLLQLKYSSSYIQNVLAYIPSLSYVISANKLYDDLPEQEFATLQQLKAKSTTPILSWNDRLFITLPNPGWMYLDNKPPIYLLAVELSNEVLEQTLGSLSIGEAGGGLLSGDHYPWTIASRPDQSDLLLRIATDKDPNEDNESFSLIHSDKKYIVFREKIEDVDATVYMYLQESEITGQLKRYNDWYWILSALSITTIIIFALWIIRIIQQPLRKLVRAFRRLEAGDLNVLVAHGSKDEFHYLYNQFNETVSKLNVLIEEVYEHKYRVQLSELRQLQSQINPHFLYNSFFSIQAMARLGDIHSIENYAKFLGEYFQYVTRNGQTDVPLQDEIKHVTVYTQIQKMRFRDRIETIIEEIPPSHAHLSVPRLILQPLVENAFKYGLENKKSGGLLEIRFHADSTSLHIIVEDNGESVSEEMLERLNVHMKAAQVESETTGLINVHRRLQIKFGSYSGLTFSRGTLGGLRIVVTFPVKSKE